MKKLTQSIVVASFILITALNPLSANALYGKMTDIQKGDYDYIALKFLDEHGILDNITNYENGTFKPDSPITKIDALKIVFNTFGDAQTVPNPDGSNIPAIIQTIQNPSSADLSETIIKKALENNLINLQEDGLPHPFDSITKAEALKMVLTQENRDPINPQTEPPYPDVPADVWYAPFAKIAKDRNLILMTQKNGGEFLGDQIMTRQDFVTLVYKTLFSSTGTQFGRATYYADKLAGRGMKNNGHGIFAVAHKTLPLGTYLLVTSTATGKSVKVKVNDRGPYTTGVDLDLSKSAFAALTSVGAGIIRVEYKIIPN